MSPTAKMPGMFVGETGRIDFDLILVEIQAPARDRTELGTQTPENEQMVGFDAIDEPRAGADADGTQVVAGQIQSADIAFEKLHLLFGADLDHPFCAHSIRSAAA